MASIAQPRIAVLLPCYNEEAAIAATVAGFRAALPGAAIYVYDNNSRDNTCAVARQAGAIVRSERQQGKGHVVRRMFADVDADVYVMADGDFTYDAKAAPAMVDLLLADQLDMVVGTRKHKAKRRVSRWTPPREQAAHRAALGPVRPHLQRHPFGLPRVLAAVREELPGALVGFRDRDRDQRSCARAADARGRGRNQLRRAARGLALEAVDLSATAGASSRPSSPFSGSSARCCSSAGSARCC